MYKSLILLDVSSANFLLSGFAKQSTKFNSNFIKSRDMIFVSSNFQTILCLRCIHLFFSLYILLLGLVITTWLSQHINTNNVSLVHKKIYDKRFLSYSHSKLVFFKPINWPFIVNQVMLVYLVDFQEVASSPRIKTYPIVDFLSSKSKIQLASLYTFNT